MAKSNLFTKIIASLLVLTVVFTAGFVPIGKFNRLWWFLNMLIGSLETIQKWSEQACT